MWVFRRAHLSLREKLSAWDGICLATLTVFPLQNDRNPFNWTKHACHRQTKDQGATETSIRGHDRKFRGEILWTGWGGGGGAGLGRTTTHTDDTVVYDKYYSCGGRKKAHPLQAEIGLAKLEMNLGKTKN